MKRFLEWIRLKEKLHNRSHKSPFVSVREVRWIYFGENIGSEINGSGNRFTRPGLILKRVGSSGYLVAPTTTQIHTSRWYVCVQLHGVDEYVCLNQVRVIDYRRLGTRLGQIGTDDFERIRKDFRELYL